jgi:hypothetical protein
MMAWIRFYFNPLRIISIFKSKVYWRDLPYHFKGLLRDLFVPKGNKRSVFEPIDFEFKRINKKDAFKNPSKQSQENVIKLSAVKKL